MSPRAFVTPHTRPRGALGGPRGTRLSGRLSWSHLGWWLLGVPGWGHIRLAIWHSTRPINVTLPNVLFFSRREKCPFGTPLRGENRYPRTYVIPSDPCGGSNLMSTLLKLTTDSVAAANTTTYSVSVGPPSLQGLSAACRALQKKSC